MYMYIYIYICVYIYIYMYIYIYISATVPELAEAVEACADYRRSRRPQVSNLPVFKSQVGGPSLKSEVWGSKSGDPISNLQD